MHRCTVAHHPAHDLRVTPLENSEIEAIDTMEFRMWNPLRTLKFHKAQTRAHHAAGTMPAKVRVHQEASRIFDILLHRAEHCSNPTELATITTEWKGLHVIHKTDTFTIEEAASAEKEQRADWKKREIAEKYSRIISSSDRKLPWTKLPDHHQATTVLCLFFGQYPS